MSQMVLTLLMRRPLLTSLLVSAAKGTGQQVIRGEIQIPGLVLEFHEAGYVGEHAVDQIKFCSSQGNELQPCGECWLF